MLGFAACFGSRVRLGRTSLLKLLPIGCFCESESSKAWITSLWKLMTRSRMTRMGLLRAVGVVGHFFRNGCQSIRCKASRTAERGFALAIWPRTTWSGKAGGELDRYMRSGKAGAIAHRAGGHSFGRHHQPRCGVVSAESAKQDAWQIACAEDDSAGVVAQFQVIECVSTMRRMLQTPRRDAARAADPPAAARAAAPAAEQSASSSSAAGAAPAMKKVRPEEDEYWRWHWSEGRWWGRAHKQGVQSGGSDCVEGAHTSANRRKKEKKLQRAAELLSLMQQDTEAARQIKHERGERRLADEAVHAERMEMLRQERAAVPGGCGRHCLPHRQHHAVTRGDELLYSPAARVAGTHGSDPSAPATGAAAVLH